MCGDLGSSEQMNMFFLQIGSCGLGFSPLDYPDPGQPKQDGESQI